MQQQQHVHRCLSIAQQCDGMFGQWLAASAVCPRIVSLIPTSLRPRCKQCTEGVCVSTDDDRDMKQVDSEQYTTCEQHMSADYLLLHTALKAGEQQRRRQSSATTSTTTDAQRRQSVPRIHVDYDDQDQPHRRTHSLKCSSSSPDARRQSLGTCRRAGSVKSTPPRSARNVSNASPKVLTAIFT